MRDVVAERRVVVEVVDYKKLERAANKIGISRQRQPILQHFSVGIYRDLRSKNLVQKEYGGRWNSSVVFHARKKAYVEEIVAYINEHFGTFLKAQGHAR